MHAVFAFTFGLIGAGDFVYFVQDGLEILGSPLDSAVEAKVCNGEGEMRTAVILVASEASRPPPKCGRTGSAGLPW